MQTDLKCNASSRTPEPLASSFSTYKQPARRCSLNPEPGKTILLKPNWTCLTATEEKRPTTRLFFKKNSSLSAVTKWSTQGNGHGCQRYQRSRAPDYWLIRSFKPWTYFNARQIHDKTWVYPRLVMWSAMDEYNNTVLLEVIQSLQLESWSTCPRIRSKIHISC